MKKVLFILLLLVLVGVFLFFFPNKKVEKELQGKWELLVFENDQDDELDGDKGFIEFDSDGMMKIVIDRDYYSRGSFRINYLKRITIKFNSGGDIYDEEVLKGKIAFVDNKVKISGRVFDIEDSEEWNSVYLEFDKRH